MPTLAPPLSRPLVAVLVAVAALIAVLWTSSGRAGEHVIKRGETLGGIAKKYGCKVADLRKENGLKGDGIQAGRRLTIPEGCGGAGASAGSGGAVTLASDPKKLRTVTHEVLADETLADIASRYATTAEAITEQNAKTLKKGLAPGQKLKIKTTADDRAQHRETYTIQPGDTLGRIARRYGVTVRDLQRMNPGKKPDRLRIGDRLVIYSEKRSASQAVGRPQAGRLVNGVQMKDGPGWYVRHPHNAWGTAETVRMLADAFTELRKKHAGVHDIVVGDLSRETGGYLPPHRSHQTGIDADIGFVYKGQKREGPRYFLGAAAGLDIEGTYKLVDILAGRDEASTKVEYMFIDYAIQKKLYDWGKAKGVAEERLAWLFQYPRGSRAMYGLVRHEPSHGNHIHIRFTCPRDDDKCL